MSKLPAFQMYPGDWMKDPDLRACSVAARGLWMDMLCLMFECDRRGYLQAKNGKPFSHDQLARMTGCSSEEVSRLLQELESSGVFSRTRDGVIFSRRQVRDEEKRADHRARQDKYRKSQKSNGNGDADMTEDMTRLSHLSSSSASAINTPPLSREGEPGEEPDSVDNRILCETVGVHDMRQQGDMHHCLKAYAKRSARSPSECIEHMAGRWEEYKARPRGRFGYSSAHKFFMSSLWDEPGQWPSEEVANGGSGASSSDGRGHGKSAANVGNTKRAFAAAAERFRGSPAADATGANG